MSGYPQNQCSRKDEEGFHNGLRPVAGGAGYVEEEVRDVEQLVQPDEHDKKGETTGYDEFLQPAAALLTMRPDIPASGGALKPSVFTGAVVTVHVLPEEWFCLHPHLLRL